MSLSLSQLLGALGMAQASHVAPALDGSYAGGSASTIALALILLAQDAATLEARRAAEVAAMAALLGAAGTHDELLARLAAHHAEIDGVPGREADCRAVLDLLVTMTEGARLAVPG